MPSNIRLNEIVRSAVKLQHQRVAAFLYLHFALGDRLSPNQLSSLTAMSSSEMAPMTEEQAHVKLMQAMEDNRRLTAYNRFKLLIEIADSNTSYKASAANLALASINVTNDVEVEPSKKTLTVAIDRNVSAKKRRTTAEKPTSTASSAIVTRESHEIDGIEIESFLEPPTDFFEIGDESSDANRIIAQPELRERREKAVIPEVVVLEREDSDESEEELDSITDSQATKILVSFMKNNERAGIGTHDSGTSDIAPTRMEYVINRKSEVRTVRHRGWVKFLLKDQSANLSFDSKAELIRSCTKGRVDQDYDSNSNLNPKATNTIAAVTKRALEISNITQKFLINSKAKQYMHAVMMNSAMQGDVNTPLFLLDFAADTAVSAISLSSVRRFAIMEKEGQELVCFMLLHACGFKKMVNIKRNLMQQKFQPLEQYSRVRGLMQEMSFLISRPGYICMQAFDSFKKEGVSYIDIYKMFQAVLEFSKVIDQDTRLNETFKNLAGLMSRRCLTASLCAVQRMKLGTDGAQIGRVKILSSLVATYFDLDILTDKNLANRIFTQEIGSISYKEPLSPGIIYNIMPKMKPDPIEKRYVGQYRVIMGLVQQIQTKDNSAHATAELDRVFSLSVQASVEPSGERVRDDVEQAVSMLEAQESSEELDVCSPIPWMLQVSQKIANKDDNDWELEDSEIIGHQSQRQAPRLSFVESEEQRRAAPNLRQIQAL